MIQIIVYSIATGRVRWVYDPEVNVPNVLTLLNQLPTRPGEAKLVYNKQAGSNTILDWQATVNAHTGLSPDITKTDWCVYVDGQNNIIKWGIGDPACEGYPGLICVFAPWSADNTWTYDGITFTPPVSGPKPVAI